jgi:endonuclease/exonuclease/phosphatase family metal-dependent hydrolase
MLKVVTINILSDLSRWEERSPLLVHGLAELRPDLVALQEVSLPENNALWLANQLGFPHVYLSPQTGKMGQEEGIAIISRMPFEYQATLDLKTQYRVAQCVQVRVGSQPLIFANGHFFWQPGESPERQQQVELFMVWLDSLRVDAPLVVCGDFNATPESASIEHMRQRLVSAYAARHNHEPDYTSPTPLPHSKPELLRTILRYARYIKVGELRKSWQGTLDYIFVDSSIKVLDCQIVLDQPAPDNPQIYPSDHFGLAATLEL